MKNNLKIIILFFFIETIYANSLYLQKGHFDITYDQLTLPKNEKLGLLGTSYLYDFKYNFYFGLGVYSAVYGNRGGFFTGGIEIGKKYSLYKNLYFDSGVFIGGGGGGSAPQGGGLMMRPHIGLLYNMKKYSVGISLNKIKFPNGNIDSNQVSLKIVFPFDLIHKQNFDSPVTMQDIKKLINSTGKEIGWKNHYFSMSLQKYFVGHSKTTFGKKIKSNITLAGIEYGTKMKNNFFNFIECSGAAGGNSDGYAEIAAGLGYLKHINTHSGLYFKASVGASGGGRVDTGGGIILKENIGLYHKLLKNITVSTEFGHIDAINGNFHAFSVKTNINYSIKFLSFGQKLRSIEGYTRFKDKEWDIKFSNQTYFKKNKENHKINLIGFKLSRYVDKNIFISGEALGAYLGGSGGYAVGLMGVGKRVIINKYINLYAELLAGESGGGGVKVGGGFVYQPSIAIEYNIKNNIGIQMSFGLVKSINGKLNTNSLDIGILYKFKTIE